jgi:hypothetical protein
MSKLRNLKAAICEGGHLQKSTLENQEKYEKKFCTQCSAKIIDNCCSCDTPILGGYVYQKWVSGNYLTGENQYREVKEGVVSIPNYCHECGKPYPWTQKFLSEYKMILELQSDEIDQDISEKIYKATEEALKNRFEGNSITVLKLMYKKLDDVTRTVLINVLSNVATTKVIEFITRN